ncbi:MAG: SPOR domain-containing protein [Proteobacteria bacterium]|nr:SPOR domain-containing protein [Pseudomonadota bacterium]
MSAIKAQQGGTFGGFLVGLLLGLVIAVGVALFVAKSPIPFIDKVSKPLERAPGAKSMADAPDPNVSMYPRSRVERRDDAGGKTEEAATDADEQAEKEAAQPASESQRATDSRRADSRTKDEAKRAEALLNDPRAGEARSDERKSEPRASADARTAAPASTPDPKALPGTPGASYVQAGAFKVLSDAEALKARLALLGLESRVIKNDASGPMLYRVRLGPFYRSDEVNRARNRLIEAGVDPVVVKQP